MSCILWDCERPAGGDACCGAHARTHQMHERGLVSPQTAAAVYVTDPRTWKRLWHAGAVEGELAGGKLWLSIWSLEAFVSSRPRCGVDGCQRPRLGDEPGCNRKDHQRVGARHSDETRARMAAAQHARTPAVDRGPEISVILGAAVARVFGRWLLRSARARALEMVKGDDLYDLEEVPARLQSSGVFASARLVRRHRHRLPRADYSGRVEALPDELRAAFEQSPGPRPYLVNDQALAEFAAWFREPWQDGRRVARSLDPRRYARLSQRRSGSTAAFGRLAKYMTSENGRPPVADGIRQRVMELLAAGMTPGIVSDETGVPASTVRDIGSTAVAAS